MTRSVGGFRPISLAALLIFQAVFLPAQQLPPTQDSSKTPGSPGSPQDPMAQAPPGQPAPSGTSPANGHPALGSTLQSIADDKSLPKNERANIAARKSFLDFVAPYRRATAEPLHLGAADRARSLVRNNAIYLSLYDALALAVENNLDVEVSRYELSVSGVERLRAQAGGNLRGIGYTVSESPTGVGGPGSPLLNSAASTVTPTTPTINDLTSLNVLTETPTNLSVQGTNGFAAGPTIPNFEPTLIGQSGFFDRSNSAAVTSSSLGTSSTSTTTSTPGAYRYTTLNYSYLQGFSPGTQLEVDVTNAAQVLYGTQSKFDPFSTPNASVTVSQPLLRGRGRDVNLRYMKIAGINQRISRLLFYQQLISTVYGVARLYFDLVSLNENAQVKRETLAAARKLYDDDKAQVEQGTLAPLGLTQAQALVTSSELDLIQSEGLVHQEEVILKSQLSRLGTADPFLANLPIVPTDRIVIPPADDLQPLNALVIQALTTRPDLAQASLQVQTGEIAVRASQNAARPELDVVGNYQNRGSSEAPFTTLGTPGTALVVPPQDLGLAGLRLSQIFQAGIQLNLPLRNHAAESDAARDLLTLRQTQARTQQMANEVRVEVENSVIALQTARSALNAAIQSREYQEQLTSAEKDKLEVGASTNFLVIQQQSYLSQARSTEVAARSVWIKARVALDRAVGDLLQKNGITYEDSLAGTLAAGPKQP